MKNNEHWKPSAKIPARNDLPMKIPFRREGLPKSLLFVVSLVLAAFLIGCNNDDAEFREVTLDDVAAVDEHDDGHDHSSHSGEHDHSSHDDDHTSHQADKHDHNAHKDASQASHDDDHQHGSHGHRSSKPKSSATQESVDQSRLNTLLIGYCILIVGGSLVGGWLPNLVNLTHARMQLLVSLVGGLMLGIGVFHLLPHGYAEIGSVDTAVKWMMGGILVMFFLLKMFHFHNHGPVEGDGHTHGHHDHDHDHDDAHQHHHGHSHSHSTHKLSWVGVFFGLALHTLIDGMALGASIQADSEHGSLWGLFGLGTFFAILLHKPLDAVSITSLMVSGGWTPKWRNVVNASFAAMCPLGAVIFWFGLEHFSSNQHLVVGCALAFSAGVFICISLGDLLPEVEFDGARIKLSLAVLTGVLIAWGIGFLEPEHAHSHESDSSSHSDHGKHEH